MGHKGEDRLYTLFDSGASISCINPDKIGNLATALPLFQSRSILTAKESHEIKVTHAVWLEFFIHDVLVSDEFLIVPGLTEEAVIGAATMQKWRIKLDFEHDTVHIDPKVMKMQLI